MKRQFVAIGLAAVSAVGTFSIATPADAVSEREPNDRRNTQDIGVVSSTPTRVSGKIVGSGDEDVFRFELSPGQDVKATLTVDGDVDLEIYEDTNRDGKLAGGDSKSISIKEGKQTEETTRRSMKSKYGFIRIMDSGGTGLNGTVNYNLTITSPNGLPRIE